MNARTTCVASYLRLLVSMIGVALAAPALAQDDAQQQGMSAMPGMQMPEMQMQGRKKAPPPAKPPAERHMRDSPTSSRTPRSSHSARSMAMQSLHFGNMIGTRPRSEGLPSGVASMSGMSMSSMRGRKAPQNARSDDYSDGYRYGAMPGMDMADDMRLGALMLDQLEYAHSSRADGVFLDGEAWYGGDFDKVWLKAEGEDSRGRLRDLRMEALWGHAIAPYWDTQAGVRRDAGAGADRTWAAFGLQGLAPYWVRTEVTLYVGRGGRTAARLQLEYDELLTQRWILQPKAEMNLYGRDDPQRGNGSGLSDAEFGLRLRYEIRRDIAPYVGIVYRQRYGHAAEFARAQGESSEYVQFVLGLHAWL